MKIFEGFFSFFLIQQILQSNLPNALGRANCGIHQVALCYPICCCDPSVWVSVGSATMPTVFPVGSSWSDTPISRSTPLSINLIFSLFAMSCWFFIQAAQAFLMANMHHWRITICSLDKWQNVRRIWDCQGILKGQRSRCFPYIVTQREGFG